jgi:hypothetical protein
MMPGVSGKTRRHVAFSRRASELVGWPVTKRQFGRQLLQRIGAGSSLIESVMMTFRIDAARNEN